MTTKPIKRILLLAILSVSTGCDRLPSTSFVGIRNASPADVFDIKVESDGELLFGFPEMGGGAGMEVPLDDFEQIGSLTVSYADQPGGKGTRHSKTLEGTSIPDDAEGIFIIVDHGENPAIRFVYENDKWGN